jgi:hypothetical protein
MDLAAQRTKIAFRLINLFHAKIKHSKIGFYDAPRDITYPRVASRIAEANLKALGGLTQLKRELPELDWRRSQARIER